MPRLAPVLALLSLAVLPAASRAATVSLAHGTLRVRAAPGEANDIRIDPLDGAVAITDAGGPPRIAPGAACLTDADRGLVACVAARVARIRVDAGDEDDAVAITVPLPSLVTGGTGDDTLSATDARHARLAGGPGADTLALTPPPGGGRAVGGALAGGSGADRLTGGDGPDRLSGGPGPDVIDGGAGGDTILTRGEGADMVTCGAGTDRATVDLADTVDLLCDRVDYGPAGLVGAVHTITGGGRFVPIPGQYGVRVDRRILPDVLHFVRRYHVRIEGGYSLSSIHKAHGEHPLGLAVDIVPGPGGTWDDVDRLAHWAEPRQNHPRWPFRWVGYNGDDNHGRGNHLHLSWMHSTGHPGHPVRTVWVFSVRRAAAAIARAATAEPPPARTPEGDD